MNYGTQTNKANLFIFAVIALYALMSLGPHLLSFIPRIVHYIICFALLFYFIIQGLLSSSNIGRKVLIAMLLFIMLIWLYYVFSYTTASIGNVYNQTSFLLFIPITLYVERYFSKSQKKILLALLFYVIIISVFKSIQQYTFYGEMVRLLSDEELENKGFINSTNFNTSILLIFGTLFMVFLNINSGLLKVFILSFEVLFFFYLFFCGARGSVVLALLVFLFLLPFIKYSGINATVKTFLISALILFFIVFLFEKNFIFDFLISISPERLSDRFLDLKQTANNGFNDNSLSGRYGLFAVSLRSWLNNPISFLFGIGDHRGSFNGMLSYADAGIGGHSELLDSLARWGLLGGILLYVILKSVYLKSKILFEAKILSRQSIAIYSLFIYCFVFKSVFYPNIGCSFFLMTFLIFDIFIIQKSHNTEL